LAKVLLDFGANFNAPPRHNYGRTAFQSAVDRGSMELVQMLLDHGADSNAPPGSSYSRTALQSATDKGSIELVQMLLDHGANVNAPPGSSYGRTALQTAADKGSMELIQILLDHGADIHAPGTVRHGTALQLAAQAGHVEVVKLLLHFIKIRDSQAHASDNYSDSDTASYDWRSTMLPAAAQGGLFEIVILLLTEGADINTVPPGTRYGTALQQAVGQKGLRMVHLLLNRCADPNISGPVWVDHLEEWRTGTALQTAVEARNLELVCILIKAGARADVLSSTCEDRRTPLEAALKKFEGENIMMLVRLLLAAGADVNLTGFHGDCVMCGERVYVVVERTMLSAAIHLGDVQLVKVLIEAGADVNAVSTYEDAIEISPLQDAVGLANLEMSTILLEAGADVRVDSPSIYFDIPSVSGVSDVFMMSLDGLDKAGMLAAAILDGSIELFQLLLDSGANINSTTQTGESITALQAASNAGHLDIVETLLRRGAEVDGNPNSVFGTALKSAVVKSHAGIAFALLEAGADPTLTNLYKDKSPSPLVDAVAWDQIDMVQMFLNTIKSRGTSGKLYVELLESSLEMALEENDGEYNIAIGMIKTEIEDSKSV
jgi:ankyrin repeat protein